MGRIYKIPIASATIGTAVQDIFSVKGALGGLKLHEIHLGSSNVAAAVLRVRLRRASATITLGSGGSAGTLPPVDPNDAAATATARLNDTTQATTSGAFTTIWETYWDTVLPFDYLPVPEHREMCVLNGGFVFDLPATVTAVVSAGRVVVEEMPG